jgi:hypothetical protein
MNETVAVKTVRNYTVEYPSMMNGHLTTRMGFITPHGFGPSQFFCVYETGKVGYDNPEAVPTYLKNWIVKNCLAPEDRNV